MFTEEKNKIGARIKKATDKDRCGQYEQNRNISAFFSFFFILHGIQLKEFGTKMATACETFTQCFLSHLLQILLYFPCIRRRFFHSLVTDTVAGVLSRCNLLNKCCVSFQRLHWFAFTFQQRVIFFNICVECATTVCLDRKKNIVKLSEFRLDVGCFLYTVNDFYGQEQSFGPKFLIEWHQHVLRFFTKWCAAVGQRR